VCAIKRKRPGLGGALIAYSGLIRAFPAMAVLFFLVVRPVAKLNEKKKVAAPAAAPSTKECPYCISSIPIKATRCPNCTSEVK